MHTYENDSQAVFLFSFFSTKETSAHFFPMNFSKLFLFCSDVKSSPVGWIFHICIFMNSKLKSERFSVSSGCKYMFFCRVGCRLPSNTTLICRSDSCLQEFLVFHFDVLCGRKLHNSVIDLYFRLSSISLQHMYKRVLPVYAFTDKTAIKQREIELWGEVVENCNETGGEGYVCAITKYNFYCYCAVCTLQI